MKTFFPVIAVFTIFFSASAFAETYKCTGASINPDVLRYDVELSFDPLLFRLNESFKEDDGSWSSRAETLADAAGLIKPVKFPWSAAHTELNSSSDNITFRWTKVDFAAGHLVLNLISGSGEFLSTMQAGGTVTRRIQFAECVPSK